jgi:NAD(P) transhydrogenase subunit alpha
LGRSGRLLPSLADAERPNERDNCAAPFQAHNEEMVKMMRPGSVIVDLAAAEGGNCSLSEANKTTEKHGVTIVGAVNLARTVPVHASQMHSKNIINLFNHLTSTESGKFDFDDEITKATCISHNGQIINEMIKKNFGKEN